MTCLTSERRTRPTDVPVADFIAAIDNARRRGDAEAVNALLTEVSGEAPVMWGPSIIGYGSYRSPTGDWPRIGFSPRTASLSLYVTPPGETADKPLLARLGKHKTGAACLYVNTLKDIDLSVLRELAEQTMAAMAEKYPN